MDTLAAALDPLTMQHNIDLFCGRTWNTLPGRPGIPKPLGSLAPAEKARAVTRGKRDRLIEKEQLGPASAGHNGAAAAFIFAAADEPGLGRPPPFQQSLRRRIVDDATIARERAPLGESHDLPEWCDAILQWH